MKTIKISILFTLLVSALFARENPFVPVAHPGRILTTPDLRPVMSIKPPEQNLSVKIDIVRKPPVKPEPQKESPPPKPKTITLTPQIPAPAPVLTPKSVSKEVKQSPKPAVTPKKHPAKSKVRKKSYRHYQTLYKNSYFTLKSAGNRLFCRTKDPLIRHQILKNPYRLVLDFRRGNAFASLEKEINTPYACYLWAGSHNDYYRIVVKMRPNKKPRITKQSDGYLITFKTIY